MRPHTLERKHIVASPAKSLPVETAPNPSVSTPASGGFQLSLDNFEGPLDLLLSLITRRKLDVTEVALSQVTDDFIAYLKTDTDLAQLSQFVVIAAILLDLKVASLLPGEVDGEEDLALLEARDLLFARLLQYRAFKEAAAILNQRKGDEAAWHARQAPMESRFASLLAPLKVKATGEDLALAAARAFTFAAPQVRVEHLHHPSVSVASQVGVICAKLRDRAQMSFRQLCEQAPDRATVVALFLAILELYKAEAIDLLQLEPMGDVQINARDLDMAAKAGGEDFDQAAKEAVNE